MQADANHETTGRERDELFEALTDRHRRRVLDVLRTAGQPLTLTALAEELALRTEDEASDDRTERLRVSLYHRHLPKLADTGLVEFDVDRKTVALAGSVPETVATETERTLEIQ